MGNQMMRIAFWLGITFLFLHLMWSCGEREDPNRGELDYTQPDSLQIQQPEDEEDMLEADTLQRGALENE